MNLTPSLHDVMKFLKFHPSDLSMPVKLDERRQLKTIFYSNFNPSIFILGTSHEAEKCK